jgi:hypothetical protein
MYKQIDYRRASIRSALRRLVKSIYKKNINDGGFVYRIDEPFNQGGILRTRAPANNSNMFATWFYVYALAIISEVLTDERALQLDWQFNDTCSMGWHKKWDNTINRLNFKNRVEESVLRSYKTVRRLGGKVKRGLAQRKRHA